MNRAGFSLLEMIIALLISSILAAGLFMTLYQIVVAQAQVTNAIETYTRAAIFLNQMEQDVMGIFVPTQIKPIAGKNGIKNCFSSVAKNDRLEFLTFITSNPLTVYTKAKNAKAKPRVVRVVYRLEQDKVHKKSYTLMRQEGVKLSLDDYKKESKDAPRAYALIEGIASVKMAFYVPDEKQEADAKTVTYKKVTNLSQSKTQEEKGSESVTITTIPHYIEITLALWDDTYEKQRSFTMTIPVVAPAVTKKQEKAPQPASAAKSPQSNVSGVATERPAAKLASGRDRSALRDLRMAMQPHQHNKPKKMAHTMDYLPEKLRKGVTVASGGSVSNGVRA